MPAEEVIITEQELCDADEVWVTGLSKEAIPAVQVDDDIIADGKPGPVWQRMVALPSVGCGALAI